MPSTIIPDQLENLQRQFLRWRQLHPHKHHPKRLWKRALELTKGHNLKDVAKATGYHPCYLRRKMNRKSSSTQIITEPHFVEVQIHPQQPSSDLFSQQEIKLRIQHAKGTTTELSFQGNVSELFPLLSSLLLEENSCSR